MRPLSSVSGQHKSERYDKFRVIQDRELLSDFDKQLKLLLGDKKD